MKDTMIKVIETSYKGYRFRSRLEARWAVFFDALGLKWEYEPEGFELGGGVRYLPDFKLLDNGRYPDIYVEVKPVKTMSVSDKTKIKSFATQLCGQHKNTGVMVVMGDPIDANGFMFGSFAGVFKSGPMDGSGGPLMHFPTFFAGRSGKHGAAVFDAATAARGARFEFGESGAAV